MLRYGNPTLTKSGSKRHTLSRKKSVVSDSKWHNLSRKKSIKQKTVEPETNLTYETLRSRTLEFLNNPDFDTRTFDSLEKSIKTLIYHDRCYPCAILLELLYCYKYSVSNPSMKSGFGATISHELDTDETLVIDVMSFKQEIFDLRPLEWERIERYDMFLPLLYKGKIYKIVNDPWVGVWYYMERMYLDFFLKLYMENRSFFENKRVFVHPTTSIVKFFIGSDIAEFESEKIAMYFVPRVLELSVGQFFIYLTVCSYSDHTVTLVIKTVKESEDLVHLTLFFMDNNAKGSSSERNKRVTKGISEGIHREVSDHLRSINIELKTHHKIIYPKEALNIDYHNEFSYDGYCAAVSIVLATSILQYFLYYDIDNNYLYENVKTLCRVIHDAFLAMKRVVIDDYNLWFFFVKSCILTTFIKHYDLDGDKPLKDQEAFLDIWSDEAFPPSYYTNEGLERVNKVYDQRYELLDKESKSNIKHKPFPTLINNENLNMYYVKLSYMVVQKDCTEALYGIVVYEYRDNTSYTETISTPVNSNRVEYYVLKRKHYDYMFSPESEQNSSEYRKWTQLFVFNGMTVEFESLSGKDTVYLSRHGIRVKGQWYYKFDIIGIRKSALNTELYEKYGT